MDTSPCQYWVDRARQEASMLYGDMRNVRWYLEQYNTCLKKKT